MVLSLLSLLNWFTHHPSGFSPGCCHLFPVTPLRFASHTPSGFPASLFSGGIQSWTKASRVSDPNSKPTEAMACRGGGNFPRDE